ncbi:hypothetical protein RSK20926_00890 [Roseobacter sp. SK209-2-6]|uniref:hypothetical protein n=1 Tax=Roseobacter sp. SK209-2-6 TaxID=388739 RepID=UPI0000F3C1D6|nr:hypothetical protein [Roseobacter sp. SK209-2-6]EBA15464.1 hypothetical protein RSK20926_00890 [Roseobacter sp. SK209-2-6]
MHTDLISEMAQTAQNDFDFMFGSWKVRHRRLRERLSGCQDWDVFEGTSQTVPILAGNGNLEDNFVNFPGGAYHAIALRSFDISLQQWAIWWLDGRSPHRLDTPDKGSFDGDIRTFFARDTLDGQPFVVRFLWTKGKSPRWEQAFSQDGGVNWKTNWMMEFGSTLT